MSARWIDTGEAKAHLELPTYAARDITWCSRPIVMDGARYGAVDRARFMPRCASCESAVRDFSAEALVPLPEFVMETVTVTVMRPAETETTAADIVMRALVRKRSWPDPELVSQEITDVPEVTTS